MAGRRRSPAYTDRMQAVLDVSNEVAAELAGIGDGVLHALRDRLGCTVNLRGNRLTLGGDDLKVAEAGIGCEVKLRIRRWKADELGLLEDRDPAQGRLFA